MLMEKCCCFATSEIRGPLGMSANSSADIKAIFPRVVYLPADGKKKAVLDPQMKVELACRVELLHFNKDS